MTDDALDLVMTRITERRATPEDWLTLERGAHGRPEVWNRLHDLMRDDAAVRQIVVDVTERAEDVPLPELKRRLPLTLRKSVVAASVLLMSCAAFFAGRVSAGAPESAAPEAPVASVTAAEAFATYLAEGTAEGFVVQELPPVVVDARRADDATFEVFAVRRVLERRLTDQLVQLVHDEHGEPAPAPAEVAAFVPSESF